MRYHQCSIMLVQLQEYIIADIQVHYNIILMYVYNIYLGISSPPQFPDGDCPEGVHKDLCDSCMTEDSTRITGRLNEFIESGDSVMVASYLFSSYPIARIYLI